MADRRSIVKGFTNNMDIIAAVGVVAIVAMIILPMSTGLLDIFLTFNITLAIIIILLTMFTRDILEFSVFPTLLLITTLFRLALNISSTRLILSQGDAGEVISAFGSFVAADNYVVGAVIFIIIVVIQFIVITNGASRVAEVAARFTLDAMPGKQMSIDADLNAGVIDDNQARIRRQKLQQEADFYGAMDGASKFVKGDAIAGIIIVFINFIGGIIIFAWQKGVPVLEAVETFGILTIGDGLVSQVPALLISTASGILVTRSASIDNFGTELTQQLFSIPKVIGIAAVLLFVFGLVPGLPAIPFFILAAVCGVIAYLLSEESKQKAAAEAKKEAVKAEKNIGKEPEDMSRYIHMEAIEIEIGYGLIPLAESGEGGGLLERITAVRKQNAAEMGILIPPIRIRDNLQLKADEYIIKIRGNEVGRGEVLYNHFLVMNPGHDTIDLEGKKTIEPAFQLPAVWIDKKLKEKAEMLGYTIVDPGTVMVTHLSEIIKANSYELLGRQEVKKLMDTMKDNYSAVVEELIPDKLSLGEVQKVLQNLLRERVPIKDLLTILEALADYAGNIKDTEILTEYVRNRIGRTIVSNYLTPQNKLDIITINPDLEQYIHENIQKSIQGSFPAIDPAITTKIFEKIDAILEKSQAPKPIILTSPRIRVAFKRLIEMAFPQLAVLSLNEIPNSVEFEGVGTVTVDDN
ncbi:MAG: flagellar biosynthesis protein FlhA [Clostridiales bacterium]|nr:flagellar biosynthesis protein FlhA [Clostridiales bacterium]